MAVSEPIGPGHPLYPREPIRRTTTFGQELVDPVTGQPITEQDEQEEKHDGDDDKGK